MTYNNWNRSPSYSYGKRKKKKKRVLKRKSIGGKRKKKRSLVKKDYESYERVDYKLLYEHLTKENMELKKKLEEVKMKYNNVAIYKDKFFKLRKEIELYKSNFSEFSRKDLEKDRKILELKNKLQRKNLNSSGTLKFGKSKYDDRQEPKKSSHFDTGSKRTAKTVFRIPVKENDAFRSSPKEPTLTLKESDRGILIQFDDDTGVYGTYHRNVEAALFNNPGKLSRFERYIDRVENHVKYYKIMFYVCVSSGGRKVNLLRRKKFERLCRRVEEVIIIDCRAKKRYEASGFVGDEDFNTSNVGIVYIMMPGGNFSRGDSSLNEIAVNKLLKKLTKLYPPTTTYTRRREENTTATYTRRREENRGGGRNSSIKKRGNKKKRYGYDLDNDYNYSISTGVGVGGPTKRKKSKFDYSSSTSYGVTPSSSYDIYSSSSSSSSSLRKKMGSRGGRRQKKKKKVTNLYGSSTTMTSGIGTRRKKKKKQNRTTFRSYYS